MTVYLDTSVAVPLFVPEPASDRITAWFESSPDALVSADWILTEFASCLALKIRRGELAQRQANAAWEHFLTFTQSGLTLIEVSRATFLHAAKLINHSRVGLRAGDAVHLAAALDSGATAIATADARLERSAALQGLAVAAF